jgi:putative sugar O-methyltransferase
MQTDLKDKTVMITGGTGSFGNKCVEVLLKNNPPQKLIIFEHFLLKYPCNPVGNPHVYEYQDFRFTFRWFKHIYLLGLMDRILRPKLEPSFVTLDVGSSYGIFSSLVKQEWPGSHHVLVDFPEQLLLAYYFLNATFPNAKIAGSAEVLKKRTISRAFIEDHDFTLIPISQYPKIEVGGVDLITNFASFGETDRKWFDYYLNAKLFASASYFFVANRVQSYPHYDTDITIQDYPVWDRSKTLHFGVSPAFGGYSQYRRKNLFFNERVAYPPYFEYIGKI